MLDALLGYTELLFGYTASRLFSFLTFGSVSWALILWRRGVVVFYCPAQVSRWILADQARAGFNKPLDQVEFRQQVVVGIVVTKLLGCFLRNSEIYEGCNNNILCYRILCSSLCLIYSMVVSAILVCRFPPFWDGVMRHRTMYVLYIVGCT